MHHEDLSNAKLVKVADTCANPSPLGLMGFGMTTILLNIHNAGIIGLSAMIVAMGLAYGGAAQVIAGIMEFKKNNTFGATAFTSYGFFWISLVFIWWNPFGVESADATSMGFYLLLWGIFTLFMLIGTLKLNRQLQAIFGTLTLLFFLLAAGDFTGNHMITTIAGWEGIICGIFASLSDIYYLY
ncbi:MAG: acetate uptake transporter, partial [Anaerovoracaceae bacterium]